MGSRDVQVRYDPNGIDKKMYSGKMIEMGEALKDSSDRRSENQCSRFASIERWYNLHLSKYG